VHDDRLTYGRKQAIILTKPAQTVNVLLARLIVVPGVQLTL
jgi:hypothetical protein